METAVRNASLSTIVGPAVAVGPDANKHEAPKDEQRTFSFDAPRAAAAVDNSGTIVKKDIAAEKKKEQQKGK